MYNERHGLVVGFHGCIKGFFLPREEVNYDALLDKYYKKGPKRQIGFVL